MVVDDEEDEDDEDGSIATTIALSLNDTGLEIVSTRCVFAGKP
jgi:hypothetical protein